MEEAPEHTLEFLLGFHGRIHWYTEGYFAKFEIRVIRPTVERPHGVRYSFTLHAPDGKRMIGFDNAHGVATAGSRFNKRPIAMDHWHRNGEDPGRPYHFTDAATLIEDFLNEVRRVLEGQGMAVDIARISEAGDEDD
jgi:hypothetical protein